MYKPFSYALFSLALFATSVLGDTTHKVRKGETLSEIATVYHVTITAIKNANGIKDANQIRIGQNLKIPADSPQFFEYKIRNGDSLSKIAQNNGTTQKKLAAFNNIRNANKIRVGQVIKIPTRGGSAAFLNHSALSSKDTNALKAIKPTSNKWKHIVIHHSASETGSPKGMDRFHREERRMENGLAYHFVIGNGRGMSDGEIHIGDRWKRQIQGGHLSSYALNKISIGICLVGNFEKTKPTQKQMVQLEALVEYLMKVSSVPATRVTTHTLIHPKHTACPGRNFPVNTFNKNIQK